MGLNIGTEYNRGMNSFSIMIGKIWLVLLTNMMMTRKDVNKQISRQFVNKI